MPLPVEDTTSQPPPPPSCSQVSTADVINSVKNNKDKDRAPASLLLFGNGDGGGGPTTDMLESLRRLAGAASSAGGAAGDIPQLEVCGPDEFFHRLEASSRDVLTWWVDGPVLFVFAYMFMTYAHVEIPAYVYPHVKFMIRFPQARRAVL